MTLGRTITGLLWGLAALFWIGIYIHPAAGGYAILFTILALCATAIGVLFEVLYL